MKKKTIVALLTAMMLSVVAGGMKETPRAYAEADRTNLVPGTGAATKFEVKPGVATKITMPVRATEDYITNPKFSVVLPEGSPIEVKDFDVYQLFSGGRSEEDYILPSYDSMLTFYILTDETAKIGEYNFTIVYEDQLGYGANVKEGDREYKQRMTLTAVVKEEKLPAELAISNIKVRGKAQPGGEISVSFQLTNTGEITARNVRLSADYLAAGGQLVPNYTDYTKRLGDFRQGDSIQVTLQVKVLKNVMSNLIQLPLDIVYKDATGAEYKADVNNILYLEITLPEEEKAQFENGTLLINNVKQSPAKPKAGQKVTLSFDMENTGERDYTDAKVYLNYASNVGFEPVNAEPYQYVGTIKAGKKKNVTVEVIAGKDIPAGLNKLGMSYTYKDGREEDASGNVELYVLNVIEAVKEEEVTVSRPKLMVSEFSTSSDVIKSGEEFDFTFKVYNTHGELSAKNIKITVNSEMFSVTKGSNSFFLREIKPGQDGEITINLKASAAAMTGSYPVNIQMEYEYDGMPVSEANAGGVLVTETKMVLIKENLRVSVENVAIGWGTTYVNQPTPLSFSIYNMGKSTLNNVYFTVEGDYAVANGSSYYYGSLQAGYPDYVEMDITPLVAGDAVGTLTIHMEDSNGDEVTYTSELTGFVMDMGGEDIGFEDPGFDIPTDVPPMDGPAEEAKPIVSLPVFVIVLVAVFLIAFCAARGIRLGCYKKKRWEE